MKTRVPTSSATVLSPDAPQSTQFKIGLAYQFNQEVTGALTYGNLVEQNSLLGASYGSGSILGFGQNATEVLGVSAAYRLSRHSSLMVNADFGHTKAGGGDAGSLFSATTGIQSRAYGVTFLQQNLWKANDQFSASVKQPLRITSGSTALTTASVDQQGYAVYEKSWNSLTPDGREVDYTLAYRMATSKIANLTVQAVYQKDALNIANNNTALFGVTWNTGF